MLEKVKEKSFYYLFIFFVAAIVMWFFEMLYSFIFNSKLVAPGILYGTWVPIYGFGLLFCLLFINKEKNKVYNFFKIVILATLLEFASTYYLSDFLGIHIWDYSHYPFNFDGRVALHTSLMFGVAGIIFVDVLEPLLKKAYDKLGMYANVTSMILLILFILDNILTFFFSVL